MTNETDSRIVIRGTKDDSKLLRWMMAGASEDEARPILTSMRIGTNKIIATDGYRIHMTPRPECLANLKDGNYTFRLPAGKFESVATPMPGTTPNYLAVIPKAEVTERIAADPKLLIKTLKGMEKTAIFTFRGPKQPIEITGKMKDGTEVYAIIMPMRIEENAPAPWHPLERPEGVALDERPPDPVAQHSGAERSAEAR